LSIIPTNQQLVQEIAGLIGPAASPALATASQGDDLFEGFLFALAVDAADSIGAGVSYEDSTGTQTTSLTLRTSPGRIWSTTPLYTHAVIDFPNVDSLEVHVGVFVSGRSTVAHECDVVIIDRTEAERCRRDFVNPRSSKCPLSVEAKFYSTPLGIGLGREFSGLSGDLSASLSMFVTNTDGASVARLLSHRFPVGAYHPHVTPNTTASDDFRGIVRKVLQRYRAQ
jgi:hypothetical protein